MTITSLTIGAVEYITKVGQESFAINDETGGRIGTCSFTITDTHAAIAALSKAEVIVYTGATKRFGGYIGTVEQQRINSLQSQASIVCRDYNSLLDSVTVPSEAYAAQTDEAILDDLFTTYLPAVSTVPVVQVKASVTVTFSNQTLRQCVETLANLTDAEWYIDANKALQWYDSAATTANIVELQESPDVPIDHAPSDLAGWGTWHATYTASAEKLAEDDVNNPHFIYKIPTGLSVGDYCVFSADVKAAERTWILLWSNASGGTQTAYYDLTDGVVGSTAGSPDTKIEELGDGVFRCYMGLTIGAGQTRFDIYIALSGSASYQGIPGYGVYVYAARVSTGIPFQLAPFTHTEDWQNLCNSVTVVGKTTTSEGAPTFPAIYDGNEPATAWRGDTVYPPDPGIYNSDYTLTPRNNENSGAYVLAVGLMRFDTSSLPDDATVVTARLKFKQNNISSGTPSAYYLGVEWYAWDGTVGTDDYTSTPSNSAAGYVSLTTIALQGTPAWHEWELTTPNNVSKTGYTGFRWHMKFVGTPSGVNSIEIEEAAPDQPQLILTWETSSTVSETRTDATSIGIYGTFKRTVYDASILTAAQAQLRGDVELARYAYPEEYGNIAWRRDGINRGDVVRIVSASYGVDADYHLARVSMRQLPGGITEYSAQYGRYQPDIVNLLRKLSATS